MSKSPINPSYFWLFLGLFFSIGIRGLLESEYENEILHTVAENIISKTKGKSETAVIDTAINVCYYLQECRTEILGAHDYSSIKANFLNSSLQSFYIGTGACGYYSMFAARVFEQLGYKPKIVQQCINGQWGAHITLVVPLKQTQKLILVDPLLHHTFKDSGGQLSSIEEVRSNWDTYYAKNLPSYYVKSYDYQQGFRYTNWDKFGYVSRAIYCGLVFTIGQNKTDLICLRMWFIDTYRVQSFLAFLASVFCVLMIVLGYRHHNP
jgi:hypothetical protein